MAGVYASNYWFYPEGSNTSFGAECHTSICIWWQKVAGATCTTTHILGPPNRIKKEATIFWPMLTEYLSLFGEAHSPRGKKKRDGRKFRDEKTVEASLTDSPEFKSYFIYIGLNVEELTVEAALHSKKQRTTTPEKMSYKYRRARKFLTDLMITHSPEELQDLLTACIDFPDSGMYKTEFEHHVLGLDNLMATLEEGFPLVDLPFLYSWISRGGVCGGD